MNHENPIADLDLAPGTQVRITQRINFGLTPTNTTVEGNVIRVGQQATGSWFAHMPDDKLWLDRIELRKANGELCKVNIDRFTQVEILASDS